MITIPHGRTARRLDWHFLPRHVRAEVEHRLGSPVIDAESQGAGFTPGFASVLTGANGAKVFVKAASWAAQRTFATSYRDEALTLAALPRDVPAPRLLWVIDEDWFVVGLEYVEAVLPTRPWTGAQLDRCLDALDRTAHVLTPPPSEMSLALAVDELAEFPSCWGAVARSLPGLAHSGDAAELARRLGEAVAGDSVVHADVRDDNLLLGGDGRVWICDWNWPYRGAPWLDSVVLLIQASGDGLDAEVRVASNTVTRNVSPEHIDIYLALVAGYFLKHSELPVPPTSPWLRAHQTWMAEAAWAWLCRRRDWRNTWFEATCEAQDDLGASQPRW